MDVRYEKEVNTKCLLWRGSNKKAVALVSAACLVPDVPAQQ